MKIPLITTGNSMEIRLSKKILEKGNIILKAKTVARKGWGKSYKKMHKNGDDMLLMADVFDEENFG